jgi:hypothetical protein
MLWGKKPSPTSAGTPSGPAPAPKKQSADDIISEMLSAYQQHFYETAKGKPNRSAEEAKQVVDRARRLISESRIGYSICAILDEIKHWPAWKKNGIFPEQIAFPATDISGENETMPKRGGEKTTIFFSYSGVPYTFIFVDEGISSYSDDVTARGKVELLVQGTRALGVDIKSEYKHDYERWFFSDVFAFAPGEWMKHVVEIAALIDAHRSRTFDGYFEDDALRRASQIKL